LRDVVTATSHYFPESGNSFKLALMLALCGQWFEPIWTDFGGGVTRTAEWRRAVNEMGEIPVLEDSGVRLTQSAPILLRLSQRHGRFGGESEDENFEILRWLFWDNHKLTSYMATYRFMRRESAREVAAVKASAVSQFVITKVETIAPCSGMPQETSSQTSSNPVTSLADFFVIAAAMACIGSVWPHPPYTPPRNLSASFACVFSAAMAFPWCGSGVQDRHLHADTSTTS
jgi:glutathione S-transferase